MKKILLSLFAALGFAASVYAQEMDFESKVHDFGVLKQNNPTSYEFVFKNTGSAPLIISNAQGSCGCTVPEWPKEPIMPGKTGKIKVTYNAANVGEFKKSVTLTSNDVNSSTTELRIEGTVDASNDPAPASTPAEKPTPTTKG